MHMECRYLVARGVRIGHINKHIGVARKVNNFLESGAAEESDVRKHAERMDAWLGRLEAQLSAAIPNQRAGQGEAPDIGLTWEWTRRFAERTLTSIERELDSTGQIGYNTAWNNQMALVGLLVCGTEAPPCRLYHIKTMLHPNFNGKFDCSDPDCNISGCLGNRLEVVYKEGYGPVADIPADEAEVGDWGGDDDGAGQEECGYSSADVGGPAGGHTAATGEEGATAVESVQGPWHFNWGCVDVRNVLVHSKNDRRGPSSELSYVLPEGILTKLLLTHIYQGHEVRVVQEMCACV